MTKISLFKNKNKKLKVWLFEKKEKKKEREIYKNKIK